MAIRDATEEDLPAIVRIYNAAIPGRMATADTEPATVEGRLAWLHNHHPRRRPMWVAVGGPTVIGWLSFQSFYGRPAYMATAEISIYVDPTYHRHGIARMLLDKAIVESPGCDIKILLGFVFGHNLPSLTLFERCAFERWGLMPGVAVLDGIERDLVIMGRRV